MRHLLGFRGHSNITISTSDVTPNAVNWANVGFNSGPEIFLYSSRQITGINQTITLKVEYNTNLTNLFVKVSNPAGGNDGQDYSSFVPPYEDISFSYINNNGTFTVSNNQYVTFAADTATPSVLVTVKNTSDGNTTIDTFLADIT